MSAALGTTPVLSAAEVVAEAGRRVAAAAELPGNAAVADDLLALTEDFAGRDPEIPVALAALMGVTLGGR